MCREQACLQPTCHNAAALASNPQLFAAPTYSNLCGIRNMTNKYDFELKQSHSLVNKTTHINNSNPKMHVTIKKMYEGERGCEVMCFVSLHTQIPSHFNLGRDRVRNCSLVNSEFRNSSRAHELCESVLFHFKYSKCNYQNPNNTQTLNTLCLYGKFYALLTGLIQFTASSLWMQKAVQQLFLFSFMTK